MFLEIFASVMLLTAYPFLCGVTGGGCGLDLRQTICLLSRRQQKTLLPAGLSPQY